MTDELFGEQQLVEPARLPRVGQVLLWLVAIGVVTAIAVIVVALLITSFAPAAPQKNAVTIADVEQLTALEFPAGTVLTSSRYVATSQLISLDAQLTLPRNATNPFADTPYFRVDTPGFDWTHDELTDVSYWSASGESGTLNSTGLFGVTAQSTHLVLVHLTRELG